MSYEEKKKRNPEHFVKRLRRRGSGAADVHTQSQDRG